jgi:pyruvate/2-oxoacid:ferredoxin oxidoreductase beta subunit
MKPKKRIPVDRYLKGQGRFSDLTDEDIAKYQREVDRKWDEIGGA